MAVSPSFGSPHALRLTLRVGGSEATLEAQHSPAASPTRRPALRGAPPREPPPPPTAAPNRRVAFALERSQLRKISTDEEAGEADAASQRWAPPSSSSPSRWRQQQQSPPASPPRHSGQPAAPASYSYAPPTQQQQPAASEYAPHWSSAPGVPAGPWGQPPYIQAWPEAQQQQQQRSSEPTAGGAGSSGSTPRHIQVEADHVNIIIASPQVELTGPCWQQQQRAAEEPTPALPACPAIACTATQTEADPAAPAAPQQAAMQAPAQQRQPMPLELPPGIPAAAANRQPATVPPLVLPASRPPPARALAFDGGRSSSLAGLQRECSWGDGSGAATSSSLSSGLSPREGQPRAQEWDHAQVLAALAAGAGAFGHAAGQHARGGGVSASDALPARLAAQQLNSLAGMSRQAHAALLDSRRAFERQAAAVEQAVLARTFYAWRHLHACHAQRQQAALAARRRIELGALRRCLAAWRQHSVPHERREVALHRARMVLARALLLRCWREWCRLVKLRSFKVQLEVKDAQIQSLGAQLHRLECRPVRWLARRRLQALLQAWRQQAAYRRARRGAGAAAAVHAQCAAVRAALGGWQAVSAEQAARQRALQQAQRRLARLRLRNVLAAWATAAERRAARRERGAAAKQLRELHLLQRALRGWRYLSWFMRTAAEAELQRRRATAAAALAAWRHAAALAVARAGLLAELGQAREARRLARAWEGWLAAAQGLRERRLDEQRCGLADSVAQLSGEAAALRAENERLCRVIDSGQWGAERVAQLQQAGLVLQAERDALAALVGRLQSGGGGALHDATNSPLPACSLAPGLQQYRVSPGGISPAGGGYDATSPAFPARPVSPGAVSAAARNKLLVRTGSDFNAMVRALKQDLIGTGGLQRAGPLATLEVDKLSLNRLLITGEGGVEVEAVGSPDRQQAFGPSDGGGGARAGKPPLPPAAAAQGPAHPGSSGSSSLLVAALRLQGIGGRSVGLPSKRGGGSAAGTS